MDPTVAAALIGAAAAIVGVGGTVAGAITGARNTRQANQATIDAAHRDTQLTLDAASRDTQRTLLTTLEAQFADRYSRALDQVGSMNSDVRIGGIYALESLALDSSRHHPTVMEVLTTFIREHSRTPADGTRPERWPLPEVQAALTVVGRRVTEHDIRRVDLLGADLANANLSDAKLADAVLLLANLTSANLFLADLTSANLFLVDLTEAKLISAKLAGANLSQANLSGADLSGADLKGANLSGANLSGVDLTQADLADTHWPTNASIPTGWTSDDDPESADGTVRLRLVNASPSSAGERRPLHTLAPGGRSM
ncbi:pentapeptide repeat-containing protein [Trebonia kvetii]|uniref:Pentapeptide repeat-containing protein n=1 Tax=Trebonia kvetii TaxID=2480626 RepID=A0A6P2BTW9_9ACTN|nr:pentapeptide repeat-containing protein [Trebonia kvetii]TVZ01811.1 pentapeptide repeat-containing protein [Trebonia kvetii]